MKHFILVSLFLVSFLGVRLGELSCLCVEDSQVMSSSEVQISNHHEHSDSEDSHSDHCQHLCSDCHFAAIIPVKMPNQVFIGSEFKLLPFNVPSPEERVIIFLRPPIAMAA